MTALARLVAPVLLTAVALLTVPATAPAAATPMPQPTCYDVIVTNEQYSTTWVTLSDSQQVWTLITPGAFDYDSYRKIYIQPGHKILLRRAYASQASGTWLLEDGTWRTVSQWNCTGGHFWVRQVPQ